MTASSAFRRATLSLLAWARRNSRTVAALAGIVDAWFAVHHAQASDHAEWPGLRWASVVKTGEQSCCIISEWGDLDELASARPKRIATLGSH